MNLLTDYNDALICQEDLDAPVRLDPVSGDILKLITSIEPWLPDPEKPDTTLFLDWQTALAQNFDTTNNWKLNDRKPKNGEHPAAFYIEVEPYDETCFRRPLSLLGNDYRVLKKIALYHEDQTRPAKIQARTKACIRFSKLYRFDPNHHAEEFVPGKWKTVESDPDAFLYENKRLFDLQKIKEHLSGRAIYSGFANGMTQVIYLDIDFHEAHDRKIFLQVVKMIVTELPELMKELDGNALHHQIADKNARGIHCGFVLTKRRNWLEIQKHVKDWLHNLDQKHPELLKDAVEYNALAHIRANKPQTHTFADIEVFPNDFRAFRLPLCRERTMLLDKPLVLLPNGKQDVVGFMDYLENPRPPMKTDDVVAYLEAQMAVPTALKPQKNATVPSQKPSTPSDHDEKLTWKHHYRQNIVQFWLGTNCPKNSLDEVVCAHARIAPYFRTQEEAVEVLQEFVRDLPEEAWGCSSRLLKRDFTRIDKNIGYAVENAFSGNTNQSDPEKSSETWEKVAKRFKQIGFDPFDKATWHKTYTRFEVQVPWTDEEINAFAHSLKPLFGKAQYLDPVAVINRVIEVVMTKAKEKNGIALPYWKAFFEDQFGIACGFKGERRHQVLVQRLIDLNIIRVSHGPMFGTGHNLARSFTLGTAVENKSGWKSKLMSNEEMLKEVLGRSR